MSVLSSLIREQNLLLGVGFLEYNPDKKGWELSEFSKPLVVEDLEDREALNRLGIALLEQSPWVRLLVLRLIQGDWDQAYQRLHALPAWDRPKDVLLATILRYNRVPPENWSGVIELPKR